MARKTLKELSLMDNFLFWTMISSPGIGEKFVRCILETVFGREFGELTVIPEKGYPGSDTDLHGIRLDVYVEGLVEEKEPGGSEGTGKRGKAVIYDLEPDNKSEKKGMLPKRVRFYHSKIDVFSLRSGEDYNTLKDVYVVMILSYDPFGRNRMVYTIKNQCREQPDMEYEDGAVTIFLYTKGKQGEVSAELKQMLKYFEETTKENAVNGVLQEIHQMVETVKKDGEVTMKYLRIMEHERDLIEQGRREERENTERERKNAERERKRADEAERKVQDLKRELKLLRTGQ